MANKMMKKMLATLLTLTLILSLTSVAVSAKPDRDDNMGSGTEYVGITLDNGELIKVSEGEAGNHTYLTNGTYGQATAEIKDDNTIIIKVNTSKGEQTFEGKLSEGYSFDSIDDPTGVNSQSASFDNLIFNINTSKKEPTEPEIPVIPDKPVEKDEDPSDGRQRPECPRYEPEEDEEELVE